MYVFVQTKTKKATHVTDYYVRSSFIANFAPKKIQIS